MNKKMWMVRAGEDAILIDDFKNKNVVSIGWNDVGDLTSVNNLKGIKDLINRNFPEYKNGKIAMTASQLNKFANEFKVGDEVITYNPNERVYFIGEIVSEYIYDKKTLEHYHIRKIKWIADVERDKLSVSTKNSLGAISTIFEIPEDAKNEIRNLIKNSNKELISEEVEDEESEILDNIKDDIEMKANEFIKDKVLGLDWEKMQELVAGILKAMGYRTRISPKGPDRGRDVIASPDGLGLEQPRIIVEVKHRKGQMGADNIRSFTGGLRSSDKGLYVSTGGFTKEAHYEAERSNIPITLIDSDGLVSLIIQYYDSFDSETRALIPLRKLYWPL